MNQVKGRGVGSSVKYLRIRYHFGCVLVGPLGSNCLFVRQKLRQDDCIGNSYPHAQFSLLCSDQCTSSTSKSPPQLLSPCRAQLLSLSLTRSPFVFPHPCVRAGAYYGIMFNQVGGSGTNLWWEYYKRTVGAFSGTIPAVVEDCLIRATGFHGIKVSPGAHNILLRRLDISDVGVNAKPLESDSDVSPELLRGYNAIDVRGADFVTVEDCYIHDISGSGLLLGGGSRNSIVRRNVFNKIGTIAILLGSFNTEAEYMDPVINPSEFH